jgi:hypothetical protein
MLRKMVSPRRLSLLTRCRGWTRLRVYMRNLMYRQQRRLCILVSTRDQSNLIYSSCPLGTGASDTVRITFFKSSKPCFLCVFQTTAVITSFVIAMLAHPEAQKKAQQEIDSVVGTDHLPSFEDENSLPYLTALILEVYRWKEIGPFGTCCAFSVSQY